MILEMRMFRYTLIFSLRFFKIFKIFLVFMILYCLLFTAIYFNFNLFVLEKIDSLLFTFVLKKPYFSIFHTNNF